MLGDIKPLPAQYFIKMYEEILEEKRKNQTNEKWFCNLPTKEKAKALHKLYWEIQNHLDYHPDEDDYIEEYCLYWLETVHK